MHPNGCTNTTCDVLITYQYNNNTNAIDVELSTKNKWIAFGLNTAKFQMVRSISFLFCNYLSGRHEIENFVLFNGCMDQLQHQACTLSVKYSVNEEQEL